MTRISLRTRIMAVAALLVALASALTGFVGGTLLRGYLIGRDDRQLDRIATDHRAPPVQFVRRREPAPDQLPTDFAVALAAGAKLTWILPATKDMPTRPAPTAAQLAANAGPVSISTGGHSWRVLIRPLAQPGSHLVVAINIDDVNSTVAHLAVFDVIAGAGAVALLAITGLGLIRASLSPLSRIERTAAAIAAGNLSERIDHPATRTEVGRLAAALNMMLGNIETAYRAREHGEDKLRRFVADASHELRTPLTSIRGLAEFGLQQGAQADHAEFLRILAVVTAEAERMGLLVDDLLLLAELDQDRPLDLQPADLISVAAEAVAAARAVQPGRPITLRSAGDDLVIVRADPARLRQVLDNLIGNALRHTPAGTPVSVEVTATDTDAAVSVADTGPGLTEDQAARVFERFYRTDGARSRYNGGTGLGLSIVDALVRAHGGTVTVNTTPGQGAAFQVSLPRSG